MILTIARKEWIERLRDGQFQAIGLALTLLLLLATALSLKQWTTAHAEQQRAQQRDREQWLNQGSRNPHSAAHFGVYAFKPRLPLSFIDPGLDPYTGSVIWVEAHYQNPARFRAVEDTTALQRFGQLSPAVVLGCFVPLLILLLTFSSFTSEKEQGTLRLTLAMGVRRSKLAAGKLLGAVAAISSVLVPALLISVLVVALLAPIAFSADTLQRALPMAAAYALYLALFVLAGLTVSAAVSTSRTALVLLLSFWALTTFAIPRAVADLGEWLYPAPTATDFWRHIAREMRGADGHSENDKRILELKRQTLQKYGVANPADLPINFEGLRLQAGEEHGNHLFDEQFGQLWAAYRAQERLHQAAALFSPLLALRSLSMAMAGTDLAHLQDFSRATEAYRRVLNKTMNLNIIDHSRTGDYYYFANRRLWESIPPYDYRPPGAAWALAPQWLPAGLLVLWLLGLSLLLPLAVRRMGVA